METVQLTKDELAVVKEALEITERVTLSEAKLDTSEKLGKFLKAFNKPLENDPKAKLTVVPISTAEMAKLKKEYSIKSVAVFAAGIVVAGAMGAVLPTALAVGAGAGMTTGAVLGGGLNHAVLKQLEKDKEILKVSLINGDGSPGKIKLVVYTGGKSKFKSDAKKLPVGKRIK